MSHIFVSLWKNFANFAITTETWLCSTPLQNPPNYRYHMTKEFKVSVRKLTDEDLMREACECTFLGTSHQSLESIYKSEHSPVRTQLFWVKLTNIPLFLSTHLLRHHVGSVPFQLTCRDDRKGGNPGLPQKVEGLKDKLEILRSKTNQAPYGEQFDLIDNVIDQLIWIKDNTDRETPVNLGLCLNAQALIDMAKVRLCHQAHKDTIEVFKAIKDAIRQIDPALADMMVPKCVYRNGLCSEPRCCGYVGTPAWAKEMQSYRNHFSAKQLGLKS